MEKTLSTAERCDCNIIHEDVVRKVTEKMPGEETLYDLGADRRAYLVAAKGRFEVNGVEADARDGVAIVDETELRIKALDEVELILVDARAD